MSETVLKKGFVLCLLLLLTATLLINLLSGYIRHTEAGLGCAEWPACYGVISEYVTEDDQTPAVRALTPAETAKRTHRAIATVLVVLLLVVVVQARKVRLEGAARLLPYAMIAVTLILSIIGPASYLKTLPAVASVNLLGGLALLAFAWWLLVVVSTPGDVATGSVPRVPARAALVALLAQIALGAWVSANFAGTACTGLASCETPSGSTGSAWNAWWYLRELHLDEAGRVITGQAQVVVHVAHRVGAGLTGLVVLWLAAVAAWRAGPPRWWGAAAGCLVVIQLALGLVAVNSALPLVVVLAHNMVASLLLLAVVRLNLMVGSPR